MTQEPFRLQPTPPGLVEQRDPNDAGRRDAHDDHPQRRRPSGRTRRQPARAVGRDGARRSVRGVPRPLVPAMAGPVVVPRRAACSSGSASSCRISRTGVLAAAVMLIGGPRSRTSVDHGSILLGLVAVAALGFTVAKLVPQSVESLTEQLSEGRQLRPQPGDPAPGLPGARRPPRARTRGSVGARRRSPPTCSRDGTQMILDNQYLLAIAETGVIGLAAMVVVIVSTATAASAAMRDRARASAACSPPSCARRPPSPSWRPRSTSSASTRPVRCS